MNEFLIIGSGFSALITYFKLKKYNPTIISCDSSNIPQHNISKRTNISVNKLFSNKSKSFGNITYNIDANINIHDRLSFGGNTNIWGGFVDLCEIPQEYTNFISNYGIKLVSLDLKENGYKSNKVSIKQLRSNNNQILDSSNYLKGLENGFVDSIKLNNNNFEVKYYSLRNNELTNLNFKKIIFATSFPQLLDLLFRSKIIDNDIQITLSEFEHKFVKTVSSKVDKYDSSKCCVIKYDLLRALKHYFGYKKNIDHLIINLPLYVDQVFSNKKNYLKLIFDYKLKKISNSKNLKKFGDSIHYCDLHINNININKFLNEISPNLLGVSVPFINQKKPGPISNDIIINVLNKFN